LQNSHSIACSFSASHFLWEDYTDTPDDVHC